MNILKLNISKIIDIFETLSTTVVTPPQIAEILRDMKEARELPKSMTLHDFLDFILEATKLEAVTLKFPYRSFTRYTWGDISIYSIVLSLATASYFTHFTAMYFHKLTEQVPKTIYLNVEQRPKAFKQREFQQYEIDAAFEKPVRVSKNVASYKNHKICVLNGMYTGRLGITAIGGPQNEEVSVTDIERTLIDITVRPVYSGGVCEVLKAYRMAKDRLSVDKLLATLKKLNHIYPYHQAVGFYLEKAGVYEESSIEQLRKLNMNYDFYLTHQMKRACYSKKWRIYFPKDIDYPPNGLPIST